MAAEEAQHAQDVFQWAHEDQEEEEKKDLEQERDNQDDNQESESDAGESDNSHSSEDNKQDESEDGDKPLQFQLSKEQLRNVLGYTACSESNLDFLSRFGILQKLVQNKEAFNQPRSKKSTSKIEDIGINLFNQPTPDVNSDA